jgi:hypothetical protein
VRSARQIIVTKRDGTLERFHLAKLSNCLAAVMRSRAYDPRLAAPLAKAVALHLQQWREPTPPTTDYIYRCVRSILQQTGLGDAADELAAHRRQRRARRRQIRVVDAGPADRAELWRKSVLVQTLQTRYGLRHSVARFMAGRIEGQVFGLGYRVVSKLFLAELVRNEVLAWGLADERAMPAAAGDSPVSVPRPEKQK